VSDLFKLPRSKLGILLKEVWERPEV
jgi:hypothetical protein